MTVDDNLYSRQIGTFGFETMGKLSKLKVLIYGLRGAAVEVAKNLILMGVAGVTLVDGDPLLACDLATNFFVTPEQIGTPRATASAPKLAELNPYVKINTAEILTEHLLLDCNVVVCCSAVISQIKLLNKGCREHGIGFICIDTPGPLVSIFVDFGPDFICRDTDGQEPKSALISSISNEGNFVVQLIADHANPFQVGDFVVFKQVKGMDGISLLPPFEIKKVEKYSITLDGDTTQLSPYEGGGIVVQVKIPKHIIFRNYMEATLHPTDTALLSIDMGKLGLSEQLHWIIRAAKEMTILEKSKLLDAAQKLNDRAKEINCVSCVDKIDPTLVENVVKYWDHFLAPVCSFVGGIVAHEVIKFTGKYHPIVQWLYADFSLEPLSDSSKEQSQLSNSERYSGQICVLGSEVNDLIKNAKVFIVGAGALGCEFLKLFSLMGVGTGEKGMIYITDDDRIEISNISRQFFFRQHHVGQMKSFIAANGARGFNSAMKITPYEIRVCEQSEDVFDDQFWSDLDIVVNALDNVKARQYVDSRCVWFNKPLLESGTLGTMGNTQVIVPNKTQTYSESQDPPEPSIPLCTLKHFPYQIEHVIEWARDLFHTQFTLAAKDLAKISDDNVEDLDNISLGTLNRLYELARIKTFSSSNSLEALTGCISIAVYLFNELFYHDIAQLIYSFPPDHKTSEGVAFWSPPKRIPTPIKYSFTDSTCVQFVFQTSYLLANILKISTDGLNEQLVINSTSKIDLPEFRPKRLKLENSGKDGNINVIVQASNDDLAERNNLVQKILQLKPSNLDLESLEFEKDDDTNHHIDFIWAATLMRCKNYGIEECDRFKAKLISGKIIPAIATTTSMIAGLVAIEFTKLLQHDRRPIEHFRNGFVNLATPAWILSEPMPPAKVTDKDYDPVIGGPVKAFPPNFTRWDKIVLDIPCKTIGALIQHFQVAFKLHIQVLSSGTFCIFNSFIPLHENRKAQELVKIVSDVTKKPVTAKYLVLEASCTDLEQVDVVIPSIKPRAGLVDDRCRPLGETVNHEWVIAKV